MDFYRKAVAALSAAAGPSDEFVGRQLRMDKLNIRVRKGIAEGGYGMVYLCEDEQGNQYALKRMLATERPRAVLIKKEIDMLKAACAANNKRVIKLIHAASSPIEKMTSTQPAEFLILTELCPGGHVMEAVQKRNTPLSLAQVISYFRQACEAVEGLHMMTPKIIHRDIKLENFLIAADGSVKLCDFGSATTDVVVTRGKSYTEMSLLTEEIEKNTTPQNRTPEMLDMHLGYDITEKADIWALGCALYCLCFRVHPFEEALKLGIINAKYKLPENSGYACFNDMIRSCLTIDPTKRPSATQLILSLEQLAQSLGVPSKVEPITTPTKANFTAQHTEGPSGAGRMTSLLNKAKAQAGNLLDSAKNKSTKVIRSVATRDTNRHGGAAGELDMTYITPKAIAMAFPSEGVASTYRNGIVELRAYLESAHQLHDILVVNVADKTYDPSKLGCRVVTFPWAAGQAPTLDQLFTLCHTIHAWQLQNPRHIVAVHCTNGKAETGTAIAAYMAYAKLFHNYKDGVKLFSLKRVTSKRPILTPSQERYVGYIHEVVNNRFPAKMPLQLDNIKLSHAPAFNATNNGCRPYVNVYQHGQLVHSSGTTTGFANLKSYNKDEGVQIALGCLVEGDVMIEVLHARTILGHLSPVVMCRFQFHTGYVSGTNISLPRFEVDEALRSNKFNATFAIHLAIKQAVSKTASFPTPWEDPRAQQEKGGATRTLFFSEKEAEDLRRDFDVIKSSFTDRESISEQGDAPGVILSDDETEQYDDAKPMASPPPEVVLPAHFEEPAEEPHHVEEEEVHAQVAAEPSLLDFGGDTPVRAPSSASSSSAAAPQSLLLDDLLGMSLESGSKRTQSSASSGNLFDMGGAQSSSEPSWDPFGNLSSSSSSAAAPKPAAAASAKPPADAFDAFFSSNAPAAAPAPAAQPVFDPFNSFVSAPAAQPAAAPQGAFDPFSNIASGAFQSAAPVATPAAPAARSASTSDDPFSFLGGALGAQKAQSSSAAPSAVPMSAMPSSSAAPTQAFAAFASAPPAGTGSSSNWASSSTDWMGAPSAAAKPATQAQAPKPAATAAAPAAAAGINFMTKPGKPVVAGNAFDDLMSDPRFTKTEAKPTTMQAMKQEQLKKTEDPVILAVDTWAEGKESNIRALLSNLQGILWEGAKWTPKQFHELVEPDAVRKSYQRACLCVHPDRNRGSPNEQLAHEIFIRLSTAFQEFENSGAKALF